MQLFLQVWSSTGVLYFVKSRVTYEGNQPTGLSDIFSGYSEPRVCTFNYVKFSLWVGFVTKIFCARVCVYYKHASCIHDSPCVHASLVLETKCSRVYFSNCYCHRTQPVDCRLTKWLTGRTFTLHELVWQRVQTICSHISSRSLLFHFLHPYCLIV